MKPVIKIKNLWKSYGTKTVLKGIDLDVYAGQVIGYIGPNGAGKSTTVKILCGLLSSFEGEVWVNDVSVKEHPLQVKSKVGYVPELAEMYEVLTPMEFLEFVATLYQLPAEMALTRIERMMTAFGLEPHLNQRMDTFSKGMRQKVLIVAGLLHNPDILILDEPLSGLDANAVIVVKELIQKLAAEGKTIFYSSHMMDVVEKISDRIVLINDGSIAADGTIEDLRQLQGNHSLEKIFAGLTTKGGVQDAAGDMVRAFQ
ncbi:MAG: ABC transporter ATP-binding protein [Bacteroidetes bacterium]|nr:MAG: ABC transporter ATP-binding protein [Bacteroidota bacterium]